MAFPTTITSDGLANFGCGGPFLGANEHVYVFVPNDTRVNLRALKSANPDTSFAGIGTDVVIGAGADIIQAVAAYQVGENIHVATKNSNGSSNIDIRYHVFNMTSETWTTSNTLVKSNATGGTGQPGYYVAIGITVRNDGAIVIVYNGEAENVAASFYDRVYYARNLGAAWSADFMLAGTADASAWIGGQVISGSQNRLHFFILDNGRNDFYQRTVNSAWTIESFPFAIDANYENEFSIDQRGCYCTGQDVVSFAYYDSFNTIYRSFFTSVDAPSPFYADPDMTSPTPVLHSPTKYVVSQCVDGLNIWSVFLNTANDIYTQFNTNSAGWSAPVLAQAAGASAVHVSCFVRGANRVLGIVYHDVDPKYLEVILSTSVVASTSKPSMMLLGVGQ